MENNNKNQAVEQAREKMLSSGTIPSYIINDSISLALTDRYLFDLISDWATENNDFIKNELQQEIINYTDELIRVKKLKG